mmetsp:Transcript_16386/g.40022  ORF Transcript_16386/g.40022 Transcript_16386/m.40022 type:complete len:306 (+) Transcript_16386:466-1383(+)
MNQLEVAPSNHHSRNSGKNVPACSSDQMTMISLLAFQGSAITNQFHQGARMPSHGASLRSSQRPKNPLIRFPERQRDLRFVDSQDCSSVLVGGEISTGRFGRRQAVLPSGHQIPANELAPSQSAVDSEVTFCESTQDSHNSQPPYRHNLRSQDQQNSHKNSHITHNHPNPSMISDSEQGFEMNMKRQGSQDGLSNHNIPMSVTSALRSRAIAIQPSKTSHPEDLEEEIAHVSEKIYDQATWRMYNRIVDHRKNQLHTQPQQHVTSDNFQTLRSLEALNNLNFDSNDNDGAYCSAADDGEIFELDL